MSANQFPAVPERDISGTLANLPTAGAPGRRYRTTDTKELFYDTGSEWLQIPTSAGGGLIGAGGHLEFENFAAGHKMRVGGVNVSGRQVLKLEDPTSNTAIYVRGPSDNSTANIIQFFANGATERMRIDANGVTETVLRSVFDRHALGGDLGAGGPTNMPFNDYPSLNYRITANHTLTFTWPTLDTGKMFTASLVLTFATLYTVTWPAEVQWLGNVAPTLSANKAHQFMFTRRYIRNHLGSDAYVTHGIYTGAFG